MSATSIWKEKRGVAVLTPATRSALPTVPGYEILRELGRGGMGVVYEARQVGLDRIVALKMILAGDFAGHAERTRFQTEAEAIARLHHPNIVQVYEVGGHEGRPFLSLEFCAGGSLSRRLAGSPLPPARAAALVESLSRAMDTAHRADVIHRDLKPANVLLVSGEAEDLALAKITDFGIAKKLDEAGQTHTGAVMGTPSYMAPEQAEGKKGVGPPADIYALGAMLYECLTGRPPFKAATTYDTLRQVIAAEPVPPRQLNVKVPVDLETICLKCLHKEPPRRYASALELAEDLRRWLGGEPIHARPVGPLERLAKWAGRRPAVAALTAALVLVAAGGVGAVVWQWRIAEYRKGVAEENESVALIAQDEEAEARALAQRKAREADARFRQARDAVDKMLTGVADERLAGVPQAEQVRRELLGEALAFYQGFLSEKADDPDLIRETARAHRRVGDIERLLGKHAEAEDAYRQALALLDGAADAAARSDRGKIYALLSEVQSERGRPEQAEQSARSGLAERERLAAEFPDDPRYRREVAEGYNDVGSRLAGLNQNEKAEQAHRRASKMWEGLVEKYPTAREPRRGLARSRYSLANLLGGLKRRDEAEALYSLALVDYEAMVKEFPKAVEYRVQLARVHGQLAGIRERSGAPGEAEESYLQSIEWQRGLADDYPGVPRYRRDLAISFYNLGNLLNRQNRGGEATERYRSSIELMEKVVADAPAAPDYRQMLATALYSQANHLRRDSRHADAEPLYLRAVEVQQALVDEFPRNPHYRYSLGRTLNNLSLALQSLRRYGEAVPFAERAVAQQREALKLRPNHPPSLADLQHHYGALGNAAVSSGKHAEAGRAAEEYARVFPDQWHGHLQSGRVLLRCAMVAEDDPSLPSEERAALARAYLTKSAGREREAIRLGAGDYSAWHYVALAEAMRDDEDAYRRACDDMLKRFGGTENVDVGHWVARTCLLRPGKVSPRVAELADRAVRAKPKAYFYRVGAATVSFRAGRHEEALERLKGVVEDHGGEGRGFDLLLMALTYQSLGDAAEARLCLDKGVRWLERMQKGEIEDSLIGKQLSPNHEAELRLLRREAEKRVKGKAGP
jgi:tetratricopeptide (TPR) repeat protein